MHWRALGNVFLRCQSAKFGGLLETERLEKVKAILRVFVSAPVFLADLTAVLFGQGSPTEQYNSIASVHITLSVHGQPFPLVGSTAAAMAWALSVDSQWPYGMGQRPR